MKSEDVKQPYFETDEVLSFRCFIQYNERENEWWFEPMCPTAKHNFRQSDRASIIELVQQRHFDTLSLELRKAKREIEVLREQRNGLRNAISKHHGLNQADTMYEVKILDSKIESAIKEQK